MPQDLFTISPQVNLLLEQARGMTLVNSQVVKEGFRFDYENSQQHTVVVLAPKVYTDGKVVVDAINDLVIVLTVTSYDLDAYRRDAATAEAASAASIELPYSTWYNEGNYR